MTTHVHGIIIVQLSSREQQDQTYGCSTQQLHHYITMCQSELSVGRGNQTWGNPSLEHAP